MIKTRVFFSRYTPFFPYTADKNVDNCLEKFSHIYDSSNEQKIDILFKNYINIAYLETFKTKPDSLENAWEILRQRLRTERNIEFEGLEKLSKSWEQMSVASRYLAQMVDISFVKEGEVKRNYSGRDLSINSTEFDWYQYCPNIPLTTQKDDNDEKDLADIQDIVAQCPYREGEPNMASKLQKSALLNGNRDAAAAMMLTTPFINNDTLFHEVGCLNGAHSLNSMAYCISLRGCVSKSYVGTDINYAGLGLSKMSFSYFNLPLSKADFFLANARNRFGLMSVYSTRRFVKVALRVIPVFELSGIKEFLHNTRK